MPINKPGPRAIADYASAASDRELVALWKSGRSIVEIASFFALPNSIVRRTIGAALRKQARVAAQLRKAPMPQRTEKIFAMRAQGKTLKAIAGELSITRQRVSMIIKKRITRGAMSP